MQRQSNDLIPLFLESAVIKPRMAILALATQHSLPGSQDQLIRLQDLCSLQEAGRHPVLTVSANLCHLSGTAPQTHRKALLRAPATQRQYFRGLEQWSMSSAVAFGPSGHFVTDVAEVCCNFRALLEGTKLFSNHKIRAEVEN